MQTRFNTRHTMMAAAIATLFNATPTAFAQVTDEAIIVTATRQATRHNELLSDSTVIDRETIAQAAPLQTLGDLLMREAGIETLTTGAPGANSSVFIRGANGGHTLLLIDGQRVGSATLGEPSLSRLPLSQIERIEILRGPASALYGSDALGGVIQVFTRPVGDGTRVTASLGAGTYNTKEASAGVATRSGPISASLKVGALKTDGFNTIERPGHPAFTFADPFDADRDGYENKNLTASAGYAFDKNNEIGASLFHSDGENRFDGNWYDAFFTPHADFDFRNKTKVTSGSVFSTNRFMPSWTSTVRLGQSVDDSTSIDGPGSTSSYKTTQRQMAWQNDVKLPIGRALFAVEQLKQSIDTSSTYVLSERTVDSALGGWNGSIGNHRLQANIRSDRNSQFGTKTTGGVGYGYQLNDQWRLRSAASTAFKAPTFNDLYYPLDAFGSVGNPNLKPERARSSELGVNRDTATGSIAMTAYQSRIADLIEWRFTTAYQPVNVGQAQLRGLSLSAKQRYGRLTVRASADVQSHKNADSDKQLILRARQHGSFGVDQQLGSSTLGADLIAVGGRYNDAANTVRLTGYSLLNLRAEHRLDKAWTLFGKLDNALDRDYTTRAGYATAGRTAFVGVRYSSQ